MTRLAEHRITDVKAGLTPAERSGPFVMWLIIGLANAAGLAYVILRYRGVGVTGVAFASAVFAIAWCTSWLTARLVLRGNSSRALIGLAACCALVCALLLGTALESRIWTNLIVLSSIDTDRPDYHAWSPNGQRETKPNSLPLNEFHRGGDEAAHLASAMAVRAASGNPNQIAKLIGRREGHNRTYWIARALRGHPPGLAMLYAPVCLNPPLARVWAFLFFLASVCLTWWAGNRWSSDTKFGLLCASCFAFLPNLNWWHMTSVSSDIPPAVFTLLGLGLLGRRITQEPEDRGVDRYDLPTAGVLIGVGTFVTYTAALAAGAAAIAYWTLTPRTARRPTHLFWLLAPAVCAVGLGTLYSKIAIPQSSTVLGARIAEAAGNDDASGVFAHPAKAAYTFVTRWPMDVGPAITVLFVLIPVWLSFSRRDNLAEKGGKLLAAMAILIPAATFFWPEIRFTYPSILLVLIGLGFKDFWELASNPQRYALVSAIASFGFSKYVLHSLLVANGGG